MPVRQTLELRRSWAALVGSSFIAVTVLEVFAASQAVFRTNTAVVALYPTVRSSEGRLISDLSRESFQLIDDGIAVPISVFSNEVQPVTAVVMTDMSGSLTGDLSRLQQALHHFIDSLRPGDRLRIGTFGREISLSHALTDDRTVLRRIVNEELWPGGASPVWRALDAAAKSLEREEGRQVIVMLTDGVDYSPGGTAGLPPLPGGEASLRRRAEINPNLLVYAVGFGNPRQRQRLSGSIIGVVRASGGGHIDLTPDSDLGTVLAEVGEELRRQYVVGFVPRHADGRSHRVQVKVSVRGATVRARESYEAPVRSPGAPALHRHHQ